MKILSIIFMIVGAILLIIAALLLLFHVIFERSKEAVARTVADTSKRTIINSSMQTIEINSVKITFDKEKTKEYRTDFNRPCDCQDCKNYYKHLENNRELVVFLNEFGIDYNCAEEVFSWDLGNEIDSLIHHEGYYGIFGKLEGDGFDFENYGVKISFTKGACVPCDRTGEFFWICVEGDFPYILEEKRDSPIPL